MRGSRVKKKSSTADMTSIWDPTWRFLIPRSRDRALSCFPRRVYTLARSRRSFSLSLPSSCSVSVYGRNPTAEGSTSIYIYVVHMPKGARNNEQPTSLVVYGETARSRGLCASSEVGRSDFHCRINAKGLTVGFIVLSRPRRIRRDSQKLRNRRGSYTIGKIIHAISPLIISEVISIIQRSLVEKKYICI